MKKKYLVITILSLFLSSVYGEWKSESINKIKMYYNTDTINEIRDTSYLSYILNDINKTNNIIKILDENDVFYDKQYVDFIQVISIAKYYGGAYGKYNNEYDFEIIPCFSLKDNKIKIYTILYKEKERK